MNLGCQTARQLINQAYVLYAGGKRNSLLANPIAIEGGPEWINAERFEISATTDPNISQEIMRGPMVQALLEDRFKLTVHRETKKVPVYVMTVLKTGLKAQPLTEGCDPQGATPRPGRLSPDGFSEVLQPGQKPTCGVGARTSRGPTDPTTTLFGQAMTLKEFAGFLGGGMDHPVIDNTGISGLFNFRLQFARDQATAGFLPTPPPGLPADPQLPAATEPAGPSIFTAIEEQVGLKLDRGRGAGQYLVIDHVERPSEN